MNHDQTYARISEMVKSNPLVTLCTISPEGDPYASSIYIVAGEELSFYFVTKTDTTKWRHIRKNPKVAMVITDEGERQTLQFQGTVTEVETVETKIKIINTLTTLPARVAHPEWTLPLQQLDAGGYIVAMLTPTWARFASYQNNTPEFVPLVPTT